MRARVTRWCTQLRLHGRSAPGTVCETAHQSSSRVPRLRLIATCRAMSCKVFCPCSRLRTLSTRMRPSPYAMKTACMSGAMRVQLAVNKLRVTVQAALPARARNRLTFGRALPAARRSSAPVAKAHASVLVIAVIAAEGCSSWRHSYRLETYAWQSQYQTTAQPPPHGVLPRRGLFAAAGLPSRACTDWALRR
jgi:hypothetical protein